MFRQALYDDLGAPVRTLLHARAFRLLCDRGRDAEAAEHALRGDLSGDPEVIELLTRVAHAALRAAAVETAAALFAATVELAGDDAPSTLLLDYAHTLILHQQPAKSIAVSERLLSRTDLDPMTRAKALRGLARGLIYTGAVDAAAMCFDDSAATSLALDAATRVETLLERTDYTWFSSGPAATLAVARSGLDLAEAAGAPNRERLESAVRAMTFECGDGSCLEASAQAARAFAADPSASSLDLCNHWGPLVTYGTTAKIAERLADSEYSYQRGIPRVRAVGSDLVHGLHRHQLRRDTRPSPSSRRRCRSPRALRGRRAAGRRRTTLHRSGAGMGPAAHRAVG